VYSGSGITPDDLEEEEIAGDVDPLLVTGVAIENGSTSYRYHAAFLPPGPYTVAFTCSDDDPTEDDALTFFAPQPVTVQTNLIASADFAPPSP
jgi:hypothetical protein